MNQTCGCCQGTQLERLFAARSIEVPGRKFEFVVARCATCGVCQTIPQPAADDLSLFYPPEYYPLRTTDRRSAAFENEKLAIVRRHVSAGRLLDVGAGVGFFVRAANAAGYRAEGVEFSEKASRIAREEFGVPVATGMFLDRELAPGSYDIITFWHVLEHLAKPRVALAKAMTVLRPGGLLIIAVPNFASIQSRFFRSRWYHLDVPRHLFHYTPETLGRLLAEHGFARTEIDFHSAEHNAAGILGSIIRLSPPGESLLHKGARKLVGVPLAALLAAGETALQRGGTFVISAVRS